jgi:hypothetical protein
MNLQAPGEQFSEMVSLNPPSWNQIRGWLKPLQTLQVSMAAA